MPRRASRIPIGADGFGQDFVNGKIFYSPATGANVVTGQVLAKYESVGGPEGDLGFPTTSEVDGGVAPASRMSTFAAEDKPVIFWTPDLRRRDRARGDERRMGQARRRHRRSRRRPWPTRPRTATSSRSGSVAAPSPGTRATKKFSTEPANLASQLAGLEVPESEAPAPAPPQASDTGNGKWFQWTWWWLLAIVPVLLLAGLVAFAVMRNRRRGDDDDLFPSVRPPTDDGRDYETGMTDGAPESDDGREDALFADRYAREGLGSLSSAAAVVAVAVVGGLR